MDAEPLVLELGWVAHPFLLPRITGLSNPMVTQVVVRPARTPSAFDLATFLLHQHEISKVIIKVIVGYMRGPPFTLPLIVEGDSYELTVDAEDWTFGQTMRLTWGDEPVRTSEKKWSVVFVANSGRRDASNK